MKVYRGYLATKPPHLIVVTDGDEDDVRPLEHRVRHSPTGMAWGYNGSGPADLALSILWDYLGAEPTAVAYQRFKQGLIATQPIAGDWRITGDRIALWVKEFEMSSDEPITVDTWQEREA